MDSGRDHPTRPQATPSEPLRTRAGHRATWPFLCILICLFILSVTSPRLWERAAKSRGGPAVASRDNAHEPAADTARPAAPALSAEVAEPTRDPAPSDPVAPAAEPGPGVGRERVSTTVEPDDTVANELTRTDLPKAAPLPADAPPVAPLPPESPVAGPNAGPASVEPATATVSIADRTSIPASEPIDGVKPLDPLSPPPAQVVPLEDAPLADPPKAPSLWPEPQALVERLDELAVDCDTGQWAMEVQQVLRRLGSAMNENRHEAAAALVARLTELRQAGDALAGRLEDVALSGKVLRAGYALDRRLPIWSRTAQAGGLRAPADDLVRGDSNRLSACLAAVDTLTRGKPQGPAWSQYLTLESLRELAAGRTVDEDQSRAVAKAVLHRLARVPMNPRQRQFIAERPITALRTELRRWAGAPVEFRDLLEHLERYERTASAGDARLLAEHCQALALSSASRQREAAESLESRYRNANVRVAVAGRLLDQLIPDRPDERQDVDDVVGGRPVHGESLTSADVALRLIPDRQRVRMALEIRGEVAAMTYSASGPATFYNDSQSSYRARKEVEIGPRGMIVRPAQVEVSSDLQLRDVSTHLDPIPLVGSLLQDVARSQHESRRCQLSAEVEQKVWAQAKEQIDREADARLGTLTRQLGQTLFEPLAALSLGPAVIGAETTNERAVVRLRLASREQLGGHTPRPRAPADSLASVQVHQSALNNVVEQLQLDGATLTLPELRRRVAERLHRPEWLAGETDNDDVIIAFAPKDAVQVLCRDGRVILTLSIARLEKEPRAWEDFQIRVSYRPQAKGRSAELVREEVIELVGEDLNSRSRIALQGVFAKTFPRHRSLPLVPERIWKNPRLANLRVTQLAIDDGWFALALGPSRSGGAPAKGEGSQCPRVATRGPSMD